MMHETPAVEWPLTDRGQRDARALGLSLADRTTASLVWSSPERRARETAGLAFPSLELRVREQLREVKKPWYGAARDLAAAAARYLKGEPVDGWEDREHVVARLARLKLDFSSSEDDLIVSHGLLLTTWLDDEIGLEDPFWFWSNLRLPDAWVADREAKSLERLGVS
jgi:broad specificity phosphatase PhoE